MENVGEPNTKLLELLRKTGKATYLDNNIGPTYDFNNHIVNSLQIILILLTKISCIPIVPDFSNTEVYNKIGITNEQSKMIQEFNQQFINIHGMIQKFCIYQYVMLSILKKMIDDTIIDLMENATIDTDFLMDFLQNKVLNEKQLGLSNNVQAGGNKNIYLLLNKLFLFFLLITASSCFPIEELTQVSLTLSNEKIKGILSYTPEQLTQAFTNNEPISSGEISVNKTIVSYDKKIQKELKSLMGRFKKLYSETPNATEKFNEIIEKFNDDANIFSKGVEKSCRDLMLEIYKKKVYKTWTSIDTIAETSEKLNKISEEVSKNTENLKTGVLSDMTNLAVSAVTGDVVSATISVGSLGNTILDLINVQKDSKIKKSETQTSQKIISEAEKASQNVITENDMIEFEEKLHVSSQLFCSYGYNLQIELTSESTINIIGDVVPYMSIINFLSTLDRNIAKKIEDLSINKSDESNETKNTIKSLISIQERLEILKLISNALYSFIIYSGKKDIIKIDKFAKQTSIDEFKTLLNKQLEHLQLLLDDLNKKFPLQEQFISENKEIFKAETELNKQKQNITSTARQQEANIAAKDTGEWWRSTETIALSWLNIGLNITSFSGNVGSNYIKEISRAIVVKPISAATSILLETLTVVGGNILMSPSGISVIMAGILTMSFMFAGTTKTIRVFKYMGQTFVAISVGTFLFVWKLTKTPFGFIWTKISTLMVKFLKRAEPDEFTPVDNPEWRSQFWAGLRGEPVPLLPIAQPEPPIVPQRSQRSIVPQPSLLPIAQPEPLIVRQPSQRSIVPPSSQLPINPRKGNINKYAEMAARLGRGGKFKKTRKNKKRKTKKLKVKNKPYYKKSLPTKKRKLK